MIGDKPPDDNCKDNQTQASNRCSRRVCTYNFRRTYGSVQSVLLFPLFLMLFNQGCASWKYSWESQEQAANDGSKLLGDHACHCRDQSAEEKSHGILIPSDFVKRREIEFYVHSVVLLEPHVPEAECGGKPQKH